MRKLLLFLPLLLITVPLTEAVSFSHLLTYLDGDNKGTVYFSRDFTADTLTWNPTDILFTNFVIDPHGFGGLGLACNNNTELNIILCNPQFTNISLNTPVNTTLTGRLYAPDRYFPGNVTGIDTWVWDGTGKTLTFTSNTNSTLIVRWGTPVIGFNLLYPILGVFIFLTLMLSRRRR